MPRKLNGIGVLIVIVFFLGNAYAQKTKNPATSKVPVSAREPQPTDVRNTSPIAKPFVNEYGVEWHPYDDESLTLTVSGPNHIHVQETFGADTLPFFDFFDPYGNIRPDGVYVYEITVNPKIDLDTFHKMNSIKHSPVRSEIIDAMKSTGELQDKVETQTGTFTFKNGEVIMGEAVDMGSIHGGDSDTPKVQKDVVHNDDVIITFSECVGNDCANGESFGFDTIKLKENNLRIKFDDTSNSASFPDNDWQLTANDSANGGANKFSLDDITGGRTPFTIEAGARNNALYVESDGDVGIGTSNPVVELHAVNGDSPTLRLQQDGSSGWNPQTWDLAGNETNFFLRDASNGSTLPFRVRPGAPSNSLYVHNNGDVGLGTNSPSATLDVVGDTEVSGTLSVDTIENSDGDLVLQHDGANDLFLKNDFGLSSRISLIAKGNMTFQIDSNADQNDRIFTWSHDGDACCNGTPLMVLRESGELVVMGSITVNGTSLNVPDYVFNEGYDLMSLQEISEFIEQNGHLPEIPNDEEINRDGLKVDEFQLLLLKKIEELTLHTIQQQEEIERLNQEILKSRD